MFKLKGGSECSSSPGFILLLPSNNKAVHIPHQSHPSAAHQLAQHRHIDLLSGGG